MTNVLTPINEPFEPQVANVLAKYPQGPDGYIIGLFRVFANSWRFLSGRGAVNLLDKDSPITLREREIVILRTCANNRCEYEWGVHVATFAKHARLNSTQIAATVSGTAKDDCWSEREKLLLTCIDECCDKGKLTPDLLSAFRQTWSVEEQLEIFALLGNYHTISFVANNADLALEPEAPSFPEG